MQQLTQIEELAEKLYSSPDPNIRAAAESALKVSNPSAEALAQCKFILEQSSSPFAQYLATSTLTKLFTENWIAFSPQQRLDSKMDAVRFLANRADKSQQFVLLSAMQLVARITKLGWFDEGQADICESIRSFLDASPTHRIVGILMYSTIVQEVSVLQTGVRVSTAQHNKTAQKFRDTALLGIFSLSLAALRDCISPPAPPAPPPTMDLRDAALKLAIQCLSFNFIGSMSDESVPDEAGTVQVPTQWRSHFEDPSFLALFFQVYATSPVQISALSLECISQIASVRRSLFSSEGERAKFLSSLMQGIKQILDTRVGLNEQENHHALCRVLARVKGNYQLQQLIAVENWPEWISTVFTFTMSSLEAWRWSSASVHYLMNFWSRLVTSLSYLSSASTGAAPITKFAPKITAAYIRTRLDSVQLAVQVPEDDPLGSDDNIASELEFVPSMARCNYQEASGFMLNLMDSMIAAVSSQQMPTAGDQSNIVLGQFAWMVHLVGSLISGRLSVTASEDADVVDGALACRVFHLMRFSDARIPSLSQAALSTDSFEAKLELAYLSFLQHFRRMYIGDTAISSSRAFAKMGELLGLGTHVAVLNVVVAKIATNLKYWKSNPSVIDKTMTLFFDLSTGFCSGKLVCRLDIVSQILARHTDEAFSFPPTNRGGKQRMVFYTVLGRLLFTDEHFTKFEEFMKPLEGALEFLLSQQTAGALQQPQCRELAVRVCRELSGLFCATISPSSYTTLFEWFHPRFSPLLPRVAEAFCSDVDVSHSLMHFVSELSSNKSNRIRFESSSANGILLFKECSSRTVVSYGSRLLAQPLPGPQDIYKHRYRGIAECLDIMTHSLAGEYANFAVFALYGDPCLIDALGIVLRLSLAIPLAELTAFAKLAKSFFSFIDVLCGAQAPVVSGLDQAVFVKLFQAIEEGLRSTDASINALCCTTLDNVLSWYLSARRKPPGSQGVQQAQAFEQKLGLQPTIISHFFLHLFRIILATDCQYLYSVARPLHVLLIAAPQAYEGIRASIVASQPVPAQQEKLAEAFAKLTEDVSPKIDSKAREKFTQSLVVFAHTARTFISPLIAW